MINLLLNSPAKKMYAKNIIEGLAIEPPKMMKIILADSLRTIEQNSLMWDLLGQLEKRAIWHGEKYVDYQWKDILSAGLDDEDQQFAPGINGNAVALGKRTSKMKIKEMTLLIELIYAFGSDPRDGLVFDGFIEKNREDNQL